jgi:SUKH-3 immunity protein
MDNEIRLILEDAGWYPGREIDIGYMIDEIRNEGLTIPNQVIQGLLKEFWNIELSYSKIDGTYGSIKLNTEVAGYYSQLNIEKMEDIVGDKLVPVGVIGDNLADILVSYNGKFYMLGDSGFFLIGNNFEEALECIIYEKNVVRVGNMPSFPD